MGLARAVAALVTIATAVVLPNLARAQGPAPTQLESPSPPPSQSPSSSQLQLQPQSQPSPSPAPGQAPFASTPAAPIALAPRVEKVAETADGRPSLAPATSAAPGDVLLYTVTFTSTAAEPLDHVRITQAIPPGVVYVEGSAVAPGAIVLFSVDGGATFGLPAELTIASLNGPPRPAAATDYTHVRWLLAAPLEVATTGYARFRAEMR